MAVFLARAFDLPEPTGDGLTFSDVGDAHPFAYAIRRLVAAGVTVGYGDGTYRPTVPVKRRHMALFLTRAAAYSWGEWQAGAVSRDGSVCAVTFTQTRTEVTRVGGVPCSSPPEGRYSVIGFDARLASWATAAACDRLRHTGPAPERVEVTAVTVAFDDLPAPGDLYIPELGADPQPGFIDLLLTALEAKLEALSHGRTDWVFRRDGEVRLPGSAHTRAQSVSLGRQSLVGAASELGNLYPDTILLAFTKVTREFPYASFNAGLVSVAAVETEDDPSPGWLDTRDLTDLSWSSTRFSLTLSAAAHELLHTFGLRDTYGVVRHDGRGPRDADSGQDSLMGLSSYGWGYGQLGGGGWDYAYPLAADRPGPNLAGGVGLAAPSVQYPHAPFTGWNKWLLGWLDGLEVVCVPPGETSTVLVRPHQQTTLNPEIVDWSALGEPDRSDCWHDTAAIDYGWAQNVYNKPDGGREVRRVPPLGSWGPAAPNPAIAIIPTSATTAVVIEADPWAASTPPGIPQCSVPESPSNRSTRAVGDIIVYDVDLNATYRPLLLVEPIIAVVSPAYLQAVTDHYTRDNKPVDSYLTTEITVHGHRIAVKQRTGRDVVVTVEPVES